MFGLFNIGSRSLSAAQFAQATAGNNAANAATPGYSRRRANVTEGRTIDSSPPMGTGVQIVGLERLRETLLDNQWRLDSDDMHYSKARAGILEQVGTLFTPAEDNALNTSLNALFAAFGDLAARPEDVSVRRVLLTQGQSLVDALRLARNKTLNLQADTFSTIGDRVTEINAAAQRLATFNAEIASYPDDPSLRDERDRIVDRLAELIGVRATQRSDGAYQVVIEGTGIQLVDGRRAATLARTGTATGGSAGITVDGLAVASVGGELGGLLSVRNSTTDGLPYVLDSLDGLASSIITAVNRVHASGSGLTLQQSVTGFVTVANPAALLNAAGLTPTPVAGTLRLGVFDSAGTFVSTSTLAIDPATMTLNSLATAIDALPDISASVSSGRLVINATNAANRIAFGPDTSDALVALGMNGFFTGTTASTIAVSTTLTGDPNLIAAAQADFVAGVVSAGDGRNAQALAALGRANIANGLTQTAAEYLGTVGGAVGNASRAASIRADTLEAAVRAADTQRQSVSGVNIDEEMADMVRFQRTYEASARFVRTVDEMIGALLEIV